MVDGFIEDLELGSVRRLSHARIIGCRDGFASSQPLSNKHSCVDPRLAMPLCHLIITRLTRYAILPLLTMKN